MIKFVSVLLVLLFTFTSCKKQGNDSKDNLLLFLILFSVLNADRVCGDPSDTPTDPLFSLQWHLFNTGNTAGSVSGEDARVISPWNSGCKGGGVNVVTVDDGMDTRHEDLIPNYDSSLNRDYTSQNVFFTSGLCSTALGCHGTAVSGIMAARDGNSIGVSGAAPRAKLGARNVLFNATDSNASDAMSNNASAVYVSNNSWGAQDDIGLLAGSGSFWQAGIDAALLTGRNSKGTIFFWAAGNGGRPFSAAGRTNIYTDDSNFDGQANYYGVNAICAIGNDGLKASYSETGANLLVCAQSLGNNSVGIVTSDITSSGGYNRPTSGEPSNTNYTNSFSGTSAASPLAAGVTALVLDANPSLTWRDVRVILARSARQVAPTDISWFKNGAGLNFSHKFGFGAIDAAAAVTLAKSWTNIGAEIVRSYTGTVTSGSITNNNSTPIANTIAVSGTGIGKIEFVEITVSVTTSGTDDPGDLQIELTSPAGKTAVLAFPRVCFSSSGSNSRCNDFSAWRFGATTFMDESADGNWTLKVSDLCNQTGTTRICSNWGGQSYTSAAAGITGNNNQTLSSFGLKIRGRAN